MASRDPLDQLYIVSICTSVPTCTVVRLMVYIQWLNFDSPISFRIIRDFETVSEQLVAKPESAYMTLPLNNIAFSSSSVSVL